MIVIADTSFVVSAINQADDKYQTCQSIYRQQRDFIYLPQSTLAETAYMLGRSIGNRGVATFLFRLPQTKYRIVALTDEDLYRTAELLRQYADSRVDFVDATIIAVAERTKIARILTLDQRDFHIIRPRHAAHFELLP
jgi:predicted nucleic acid-binding protein